MIFRLLIPLFLLFGCGGKKPVPKQYPSWWHQPHQDTNRYIYGLGEGSNQEEAISRALNQIASKITTEIESTYQSRLVVENGEVSKSQSIDIRQSVKKMELDSYKIIQSSNIGGKTFLLLQLDRVITAKNFKRKLKREIELITSNIDNPTNSKIEKIGILVRAKKRLEKIFRESIFIKTLSPEVSDSDIVQTIQRYRKKISHSLSQVEFRVLYGGKYGEVVKKLISEYGFSISQKVGAITIFVNVKREEIMAMGNYILKVDISLETRENRKVVAKEQISIGGKSKIDFGTAENFAIKEFEERLRDEKIVEKLMGI